MYIRTHSTNDYNINVTTDKLSSDEYIDLVSVERSTVRVQYTRGPINLSTLNHL